MYEGRAWGLASAHALHYAYVHKPEVIIVNGGARTTHQRSYNMDGQWPVPGSGQHYTVLGRGPAAAAMTVVYNNFDIDLHHVHNCLRSTFFLLKASTSTLTFKILWQIPLRFLQIEVQMLSPNVVNIDLFQ